MDYEIVMRDEEAAEMMVSELAGQAARLRSLSESEWWWTTLETADAPKRVALQEKLRQIAFVADSMARDITDPSYGLER
jgi:hypothetical protein